MKPIRSHLLVHLIAASVWMACCSALAFAQPEDAPLYIAHRAIDYLDGADYADGKDKLDIFVPPDANRAPVLVFFHGGGLMDGDKHFSNYGAGLDPDFVARRFVPEGLIVVLPNYRLSPDVMHPAHAQDAAAAWDWVVRNISSYGGDAERIFLSGHSAGGYLAALLSLDPSYLGRHGLKSSSIRGTIPVSAFLYVEETARDRPKTVWGSDPQKWLQASVSPYIGAEKPPMLLIFADGDAAWRKDQNRRFQKALKDAGNAPVGLIEIADRDHMSLWTHIRAEGDPVSRAILEFVVRHH